MLSISNVLCIRVQLTMLQWDYTTMEKGTTLQPLVYTFQINLILKQINSQSGQESY